MARIVLLGFLLLQAATPTQWSTTLQISKANLSRTWLLIPNYSMQQTEPPKQVIFVDYPDTSEICSGTIAGPSVCVTYREFKLIVNEAR